MKNQRIRILYVTEAFGGGVYRYLVELCNQLADRAEIYLLYGMKEYQPPHYIEEFDSRIHLIPYDNVIAKHRKLSCLTGMKRYRQIVKEIQPDIIHLHSSVAGIWGRWAYAWNSYPTFYTPHGFAYLNERPKWKMNIYWAAERISALRHCVIIACGKQEYEIAKRFRKDSLCVYNGINLDKIHEVSGKKPSQRESKLKVVTVGRKVWQKNPALFDAIAEKVPQAEFLWIGDNSKDGFKAANITMLGVQNYENTLRTIEKADIFLLPSLFEGLSYALLEAMALRKICLVSDVPGNSSIIQDGKNGFVCSELKQYVRRIQTVTEAGNEELEQIRDCAYQTVKNTYNSKLMADKYYEIYENTIKLCGQKIDRRSENEKRN